MSFVGRVSLGLLAIWMTSNLQVDALAGEHDFFETRIRPVLVEHCYQCHNSAETSDGELAVDHRKAMIVGGAGGPIIVPGDAAKSRLIAILRHEVDGLEMPEDGPKLSESIVGDFEKWINEGAVDPRDDPPSADELSAATSWPAMLERRKQWWSFQPITDAQPPSGNAHPIDRFIEQQLDKVGLQIATPVAPDVLVRRLYFNLTGLPPTAAESTQWTQRITAAGARDGGARDAVVELLIDELLESPRFGERWARHWMDWIRYAESHGSEGDPQIDNAWMYRDYLIRALNADVPYDQLLREHLAGDLLESPRLNHQLGINESVVGPSHWRMVFHGFAPTDALDEKVRFIDDQINTFSKAFLGVTVSCARCHDHKFDAISQADYYALFGVFASCRPARSVIDLPQRQLINRDDLAKLKPQVRDAISQDWLDEISDLPARLRRQRQESQKVKGQNSSSIGQLFAAMTKDEKSAEAFTKSWKKRVENSHARDHTSHNRLLHWDLSKQADYDRWFRSGIGLNEKTSRAGEFAIADSGDAVLRGIYPAGAYSHLLSGKHPARLTSDDFTIGENSELWVLAIGDNQSQLRYVVHDYPRNGTVYPVTKLANAWRWQRYDLAYWNGEDVHVEIAAGKDAPLLVNNQDRSWFGIRQAIVQEIGQPSPEYKDEALLPFFTDPAPSDDDELAQHFQSTISTAIRSWRADSCSDAQALLLDACLREGLLANKFAQLPSAAPLIDRYRQLENEVPVPTRVPGLDETIASNWPLYVRGNHKTPGDVIPRRFLEAIDSTPFATQQSGRRELAEKLLDDNNPLTRRVIVNRLWHHLFGRGIVATPDNFGRLGQQPTHDALLDYLANEFRNDGWSLKKTIRRIVTSKTWQQSAQADGKAQEIDPDNQWLSHANVRRLEAEAIRDSMLSVSGQLADDLFGPPVSGNARRRSIYVRVIRNSLDPFLRAFDFPEPFSTVGRRDVTNVPAQSLTMMNDPVINRHANEWAKRVIADSATTTLRQRATQMFLTAFGRPATDRELGQVRQYFDRTEKRIESHRQRVNTIRSSMAEREQRIGAIVDPVRNRLLSERTKTTPGSQSTGPIPIGHWDFSQSLDDLVGDADGKPIAGAQLAGGGLTVDGNGYVLTTPIKQTLRAKTLEVWVQLADLDQRGGGAITIQSPNGVVFDSIVFGERDPRQWMAGSNGFARTESFNAPQETLAAEQPVHVAIVYQSDGKIIGYRDGQPYGKPYQSRGPVEFNAGEAAISFGLRHLPAGGNRMLQGRILKANLYDRALTADEVAVSSGDHAAYLSDKQLLAALGPAERSKVHRLREQLASLQGELESIGKAPASSEQQLWADLAQAIFTFKEFIYIR